MAPLPAPREGSESMNKANSQLSQRSPAAPLPARREGPESVNKSDFTHSQLLQLSRWAGGKATNGLNSKTRN